MPQPTPLANALAQYAPPQQTPSTPLANALMEYAARVKGDFQHGLDESAQGFGEMVNGQLATGIPRTFLGGLGWMGSPVSGAVSPLLNPVLQPMAQGVHDYVGKPLESATGYPADLTTELALALALPKALHGAGKVVNHSAPYLASLGDAVGSRMGGAPEGSYMSGPGPKSPISSPVGGDDGIIAYHGSPHTFDKFSMDKIGTGEGAQAYGHGLYFAENENVAGTYRNLAPPPTAPIPDDVKFALKSVDNLGFNDSAQALSAIRSHPDWMSRWDVDPSRSAAEAAASDKIKNYIADNPRGSMYQVRLNVKPHELLDWDKPLSEQPEVWSKISGESKLQSQQAILADGDRLVTYAQKAGVPSLVGVKVQSELRRGASLEDAFASVRNLGGSIQDADKSAKWVADVDKLKDAIGSSDVSLKGTVPGDWIGAQIAKDVPGMKPNEIAETLKAKGVKGIRYKDAGSRGSEGGTYNYVIFDDKLITILKKYGIPMTAGAGGAMMVAGQNMPPEVANQLGPQS